MVKHLITLCAALTFALPASGETLVDSWIASYDAINSLSCETRKQTVVGEQTLRAEGHMYFQRPLKMHVQEASPLKRYVISDGETLYYFGSADANGVKTPLSELPPEWNHQLQTVPGSPLEHLFRMVGLPEEDLPAKDGFPVRKGYRADHIYVVAATDDMGRLTLLEFYRGKDFQQKAAQYMYDDFQEVLPDVWLPATHKAVALAGGKEIIETTRFTDIHVNENIDPDLFDIEKQLPDVEFLPPPTAPSPPK